ncbi:MAG: RNA polymerase sigma factor [Phycisphaerae bacterium]
MHNPLRSDSPSAWVNLIESIGPASMLVVIDSRMSDRLRSAFAAEDVWQDVLLQAWRDRDRFEWRGVKSFRTWLLTLIDHRIRDAASHAAALKRGGGAVGMQLAPGGDGTAAGIALPPELVASTTPSRVAIRHEQAAAMRAALDAVPGEFREVVRLRLFEQMTLEQIAERLGLTLAAVRYRFGRGADAYRRLLRAHQSTQPAAGRPRESTAFPPRDSAS